VEPQQDGGWYLGYFRKQGVSDMKMGPWVSGTEMSAPVPIEEAIRHYQKLEITQVKSGDHRAFECTMPLTATIGPKSVQCFIRHEISSILPGTSLCIYMKTETPYAPYGTSFHTDGRLCLTSGEGGLSTRIVHHYRVVFTKSTILKGESRFLCFGRECMETNNPLSTMNRPHNKERISVDGQVLLRV
jgi:hypothetical protein